MMNFKGTGVALVTPFDKSGNVDVPALRKLVQLQIKGGTDFLVVQGTTGETATLTEQEKELVLNTVIKENNGELPIVLGLAGNCTRSTIEAFKSLNNDRVDGILSASPHYNKPSQEGIYQHFKALAEATDKPIILYNVPGRTASNMTADTTLRLAEIKNIVAIKEASGDLEQLMSIIQHAPKNFNVLSGEDALTLPMISTGADGVISVVANAFPELFSEMVKLAMEGDFTKACVNHYRLLEVTKHFFAEGNPSGVKAALKARGVCEEELRLPLTKISENLRKSIIKETSELI